MRTASRGDRDASAADPPPRRAAANPRVAHVVYLVGVVLLAVVYFQVKDTVSTEVVIGVGFVMLLKLRFLAEYLARRSRRTSAKPSGR